MHPIAFILLLLATIAFLLSYMIRGFAILRFSKRYDLGKGWAGFVPVLSEYQLGSIAGNVKIGKMTVRRTGLWMALRPILVAVTAMTISILATTNNAVLIAKLGGSENTHQLLLLMNSLYGWLLTLLAVLYVLMVIYSVFYYMVLSKIFANYHDNSSVTLYVVLSIFVPLVEPFLLFWHSFKKPIYTVSTVVEADYTQEPDLSVE